MRSVSRLLPTTRFVVLAFVTASIAAVMSERFFWFWSPAPLDHAAVAAFYALPTAAALLVVGRFGVSSTWSLLLVAPVFAYVIEGVLTPILYTGGPFNPFFPAWFTWWHGIMALVLGVFVVRAWLLASRRGLLALASIALGCFWGIWASTLRLPENVEDVELLADHDQLVVLGPGAFARYAITFTGIFMVAHLVLGFVWPKTSGPWPTAERVLGGLIAIAVVGWTVALPWALPMFVLYLMVPWRALRWHRDRQLGPGPRSGPDLIAQLRGRVHPGAVAPLALLAPSAWLAYAALWLIDPSDQALRIIMYGTIAAQGVAATVLLVVAVRRVRPGRPGPDEQAGGSSGPLSGRWPSRGGAGSPERPGSPDRVDEGPRHGRTPRWAGGWRQGARSMPAR